MNTEEVTRKLEILAQRVDLAVYMHIDSLWLFGSSLYKETPKDIDVLVVYHNTPEDNAAWQKYFHEEVIHLPLCDHYKYSSEHRTSLKLRQGMKNVDLHFAQGKPKDAGMLTECFVLVWSHTEQDIKANLNKAGYGTFLTKKLGLELASLRSQLKEKSEENSVLNLIVFAIIGHFNYLSMKQRLCVAINVLARMPKNTVKEKRIREILKEHSLPEEHIIASRMKGSKVMWFFSKEAKEKYGVT